MSVDAACQALPSEAIRCVRQITDAYCSIICRAGAVIKTCHRNYRQKSERSVARQFDLIRTRSPGRERQWRARGGRADPGVISIGGVASIRGDRHSQRRRGRGIMSCQKDEVNNLPSLFAVVDKIGILYCSEATFYPSIKHKKNPKADYSVHPGLNYSQVIEWPAGV